MNFPFKHDLYKITVKFNNPIKLIICLIVLAYVLFPGFMHGHVEMDAYLKGPSVESYCAAQSNNAIPLYYYGTSHGSFEAAYKIYCSVNQMLGLSYRFDDFRLYAFLQQSFYILLLLCFILIQKHGSIISGVAFLLILPEIYITSYYGSFTPTASLFVLISTYFMTKKNFSAHLLSALFIGIASIFRMELLVLFPAVTYVTWLESKTYRKSRSYFVSLICIFVAMNPIAGHTFERYLFSNSAMDYFGTTQLTLSSYYSFFSIPFVYFYLTGVRNFFRDKDYKYLVISIVPLTLLLGAFGNNLTSPRYLVPLTPLLVFATLSGFASTKDIFSKNKPIMTKLCLAVFVIVLGFPAYQHRLNFVKTHDGPRLALGRMFEPLYQSGRKLIKSQFEHQLRTEIQSIIDSIRDEPLELYFNGPDGSYMTLSILHDFDIWRLMGRKKIQKVNDSYKNGRRFSWKKSHKRIFIATLPQLKKDLKYLEKNSKVFHLNRESLFDLGPKTNRRCLKNFACDLNNPKHIMPLTRLNHN